MNQTESKALLEKLDSLMAAADKFGTESEQLASARGDFQKYMNGVGKNNEELKQVIAKCNEYIDEAQKLVNRDLSNQIAVIVEETVKAVSGCKEQCESLTKEYEEILRTFGGQKAIFEQKQDDVLQEVKTSLSNTDTRIAEIFNAVNDSISSNYSTITEIINSGNSETVQTAKRNSDRISKELKENASAILLDTQKLKKELETINNQQKKDHVLIIASAVFSAIAVITTVTELFI